jgi:hypothetical protein
MFYAPLPLSVRSGDAMNNTWLFAFASMFVLSYETGEAQTNKKPPFGLAKPDQRPYSVQTVSVQANCFPQSLRDILAHIAAQTRGNPLVTSGYRAHASRSGSMHRSCMAADIRVPGVSDRQVIQAAESAPGIGGIGNYCNGIIHVDIGPKRRWTDC